MSSGSNQTNEIQEMRNSMKINFINHMRTSKQKQVPQTLSLYTDMKSEIKTLPQFTFKIKDKTLDWNKISKLDKQDLKVESKDFILTVLLKSFLLEIDEINDCVNNMTYARLQKEDIEKMGWPRTIQTFKLLQLSIEYSSHLQHALGKL